MNGWVSCLIMSCPVLFFFFFLVCLWVGMNVWFEGGRSGGGVSFPLKALYLIIIVAIFFHITFALSYLYLPQM